MLGIFRKFHSNRFIIIFTFKRFPVPDKGPHLGVGPGLKSPVFKVSVEAGLVNRHYGREAHRDRGELPEARHEPGMGIGGEAVSAKLPSEIPHLLDRDGAFKKRSRVYARRGVSLEVDHVPFPVLVAGPEEMVKAYLDKSVAAEA